MDLQTSATAWLTCRAGIDARKFLQLIRNLSTIFPHFLWVPPPNTL